MLTTLFHPNELSGRFLFYYAGFSTVSTELIQISCPGWQRQNFGEIQNGSKPKDSAFQVWHLFLNAFTQWTFHHISILRLHWHDLIETRSCADIIEYLNVDKHKSETAWELESNFVWQNDQFWNVHRIVLHLLKEQFEYLKAQVKGNQYDEAGSSHDCRSNVWYI